MRVRHVAAENSRAQADLRRNAHRAGARDVASVDDACLRSARAKRLTRASPVSESTRARCRSRVTYGSLIITGSPTMRIDVDVDDPRAGTPGTPGAGPNPRCLTR
ncbi:hypothetical protein GCM10009687_24940 [Asanoa iriomotensis]|uniref:Uncharacterized protein n=1 Tax=Asanoa iriomotensis TaxID=234613 RepID=A0ABQ4BWV9_9ACTN|nr:hypothetical protein Air01nite_11120 [Asanoa iriomotensis]